MVWSILPTTICCQLIIHITLLWKLGNLKFKKKLNNKVSKQSSSKGRCSHYPKQNDFTQNNCLLKTENNSYHTILRNNKIQCMLLWRKNTHLPLRWQLTTKFSRSKSINTESVKTKIYYLHKWECISLQSKHPHDVYTLSIAPVHAGSIFKLSF
jgi:hypothetical protein